jgi:hypothetical protein
MSMKYSCNDIDRRKQKYSEETLSDCHVIYHKSNIY